MRTILRSIAFFVSGCLVSCLYGQERNLSLYFQTGASSLDASETRKLQDFVNGLDRSQVTAISVTAYCDDRGSDAFNMTLSAARAESVRQALGAWSSGGLVHCVPKGEIALRGGSKILEERRHNRRVDVLVSLTVPPPTAPVTTAPKEPEPAPVAEKAKPAEVPLLSNDQKVGDKITLHNILFAGGRHILLPESYESLEALKDLLLEKKKYHILILGHICCITSGEDGMDFDTGKQNLSVARARAVYEYLVQNGIDAKRLSYKGMRAKYPTGKGDRDDRRVEIEITKVVEE